MIEQDIFSDALELTDPAARRRYIAKACGKDAALYERIIALIKSHEEAGDFIRTPAQAAVTLDPVRCTEQPGTIIDRYNLLQQIGEGGFGTVWMAEQTHPVSRRVALKVIKLGMDTREVIARFEAERQALAMMDHPNIAKVLDAGTTDAGRPYFVMELVKGIPITQFCDERQLSLKDRLALFADVCSAINHAHQKGIIHRDIKPSNVMVTLHGDKPVVKVIDFGVAKATQGKLTNKTLFTRYEQFIGTPVYMSPEQAALSGLDIDTRSDIYALGILLYELLTGKPPFDSKSLAAAGYEEMRRIIREVEPPRPSTRLSTVAGDERTQVAKARRLAPEKLSRLVEADLDWIVMKAIDKDRSRRYETANGLALDIQRFLSDEPVSATPPSAGYQLRKFARRNKTALRVAAAIAAMLLVATGVSSWQAVRATRAENKIAQTLRQVAAERDAKEQARKDAQTISTFLTDVFQSPDPKRDGRTITVAELLDKAAKKLETDLADQPQRRTKLQGTLGHTYRALGLSRQAIPLQEQVLEFSRKTLGPEHPETLWAMLDLANSYFDAGHRDEALKMQEELLPLCRKVFGPSHHDTIMAMNNLANSYHGAGRRGESLKMREEVLRLRRKVLGPEHPDTIMAMNNLATSYADAGRRDEAIKMREQVLTLRRKVNGPEHPDTLGAMINLATSYAEAGRRDEALKIREQVLPLSRKVDGPEHPDTLGAMGNLALSYASVGRWDVAIKVQEEVLSLRRKTLGPEHPGTLAAMNDLAISYFAAGRRDETLKIREQLLSLRRKVLGPEHPDTLGAMENLALSYDDAGRWDEAIKMHEQVLALWRKALGPEHPLTLSVMHNLSDSYADAGRNDEALKMREDLLTLRRRVLGPEHPDTLMTMLNVANSYVHTGRRDEATKMLEQVLTLSRKVLGPEHPDTLIVMRNLAFSYADAGRSDEALKMREEVLRLRRKVLGPEHPDTLQALADLCVVYLARAAEQAWFGQEDALGSTCDKVLELAKDAKNDELADRASKACSLRKSDPTRQAAALVLARRAVELGKGNIYLPYFQMALGMAEYRSGHYAQANAALLAAGRGGRDHPVVPATSAFYRAMSLFQQGKTAEARHLLPTTTAIMEPFPADEKNPLAKKGASYDDLILWMACKEARALLKEHGDALKK